jgi:hypothetical protein
MLLVPRQLLRSGMTGSVPYYGGRFTPAQAWAAAHPTAPAMGSPAGGPAAAVRPPVQPAQTEAPSTDEPATKAALRQLRESGVLTAEEYDDLLRRTNG